MIQKMKPTLMRAGDVPRSVCGAAQARMAKLRSLAGLLTQQALSLRYYQDAGLQAWSNRRWLRKK